MWMDFMFTLLPGCARNSILRGYYRRLGIQYPLHRPGRHDTIRGDGALYCLEL
jgi:hypothetical protein